MTEFFTKKCPHATLYLLAGFCCLLHVVVRFYFLLSSLRVLFFDLPPQEFCGPSKLFYTSSTKNIIILQATASKLRQKKRSFLPQNFVKYINCREGTSCKIQIVKLHKLCLMSVSLKTKISPYRYSTFMFFNHEPLSKNVRDLP